VVDASDRQEISTFRHTVCAIDRYIDDWFGSFLLLLILKKTQNPVFFKIKSGSTTSF